MSGTVSLILIALIFCLVVFRDQIHAYVVDCIRETAEAALRDSGSCCCYSAPCSNNSATEKTDLTLKTQSYGRFTMDNGDNNNGRNEYYSAEVTGISKDSFFIYSPSPNMDKYMASNKDCDITYKSTHVLFESFAKKVVKSYPSNDDNGNLRYQQIKYDPTMAQDDQDDPDDLA